MSTNNQNPKPLTKEAVLIQAQRLMLVKGQTSTLEVKLALRSAGFFALQDDVSSTMSKLADEEKWEVGDNGHHRLYSGTAIQAIMNDTLAVVAAVNNGTAKKVHAAPAKTAPKTAVANKAIAAVLNANGSITKAAAKTGDWEANSALPNQPTLYFPKSLGRDKVRSAYAKITGTHRNDARARQVK